MILNGRTSVLAAVVIAFAGASMAATADDLSKGVPSKEAAAKKTALKLAGLATFVATSCQELKLNPERFKSAITALGLSTKDLDQEPTKFAYLQYTMTYKKDVKANCARARTEFGPGGRTLPDLFQVVAAAPKPPASGLPTPAPKAPDAIAPDSRKP